MVTGKQFYDFHTRLRPEFALPEGISVINPYTQPEVRRVFRLFCDKYYSKNTSRVLILGINAGRFGAGVTGVPFTDPLQLESVCGIENTFQKKQELSSKFIYEMIAAFGGAEKFYDKFILSAVCPIGFLNGPVNYNYYDSPAILNATRDFISYSLRSHTTWNTAPVVICLGKKNASYLEAFNSDLKLFEKVITLEHPRYILQYKLKTKHVYIDRYCEALNDCLA